MFYHESYMLDNSMMTILDYARVTRFYMLFLYSPLFIIHLGRYWRPWVACSGSDPETRQEQEYFKHLADLQ